ncbi:substrate-binding periplasmic protein [Bacterioplanes sanyensis]|nr:transporter substrate-binding domain-containing protein [Bacterioplanes sanyensis]
MLRLVAFLLLFTTLQSHALRIISLEEPPTNYRLNGTFTGTTTELVEALRQQLAPSTNIEVLPPARVIHLLQHSETPVLAFTIGRTAEREALGWHFIGPVITRRHVIWVRQQYELALTNGTDILSLTLSGTRGDWRVDFWQQQGSKIEQTRSHVQGLRMMHSGRTDGWISSDIEAPILAATQGIAVEELKIAHTFRQSASYLVFSANTPAQQVERWQQAYQQLIGSDFVSQQAQYWSGVLGYPLTFDPKLGYHMLEK